MLEPEFCRKRQHALLSILQDQKLDALVLGASEHVYYASGHRAGWLHSAAFVLFAEGRNLLIAANTENPSAVADQQILFEANWYGTQRQEQPGIVAEAVNQLLKQRTVKRVGIDASAVTSQLCLHLNESTDTTVASISQNLWKLRRHKWPDELKLMRTAIDCTKAMYDRARELIEPGLGELELYTQLHTSAVLSAGEPMTALLGNDYACGSGGGPPRAHHVAQAGQLWILDLGPSYRGYFADTSRVFAVGRKPTDEQYKAWQSIVDVFPIVEALIKPRVSCRAVFAAVDEHFKAHFGHAQSHHLGHGVGLQPHEFPHLNPKWDDTFVEGDVFTVEPGVYHESLQAGIRIENQYRVTAIGVENLVDYPMELI